MIGFFKWLARLIGGNGFPTKYAGDLPNSANNTASRIAPAAFGFGGEKWVGVVGESHYQRAIARCFGANVGPRQPT
jgi:hypothetical protein